MLWVIIDGVKFGPLDVPIKHLARTTLSADKSYPHISGVIFRETNTGLKPVRVWDNTVKKWCKEDGVRYGIGIENKPGDFGMTHGPTPYLSDLEDEIGEPKSRIIRFNADLSCTVIRRWNNKKQRWIDVEE